MPTRLRAAAMHFFRLPAVCGALVLCCSFSSFAQSSDLACGPLDNAYGPFDYRTDRDKLSIVERFHFAPEVESLIRGKSGRLGGDLDYTLRAFPNHHRALIAVMRYGEKLKSPQPADLPRPVECYFERALRFRPDDVIARMIYSKFLAGQTRKAEAIAQLQLASAAAKDNGFSHYNVGLIYLELGEYEKALVQAHRALELGYPATGLRDQLKSAGRWAEPAGVPPSAVPADASASNPPR